MSLITFKPNDIVFVEDVGYGTLLDCGNLNAITIQNTDQLQRKESLYFDPGLFDPVARRLSKDSQTQISQCQRKVSETPQQEPQTQQKIDENKQQKRQPPINIVRVKLDGTEVIIHTPDQNLRKNITLKIKPFFAKGAAAIDVNIDFTRTIETLKRQVFEQLGLKIAYYYNIKILTTRPKLNELTVHSKTIFQYGLLETSNIIMTADHGFCLQDLPNDYSTKYSLANNAMTLVSLNQQLLLPTRSDISIALPPPPVTPVDGKNLKDGPSEQTSTTQKQQLLERRAQEQDKSKIFTVPSYFFVKGNVSFNSGRHYWEVRLDKLPKNKQDLEIGVINRESGKVWVFLPLKGHKIIKKGEENLDLEQYGVDFKENDTIGVFLRFNKNKNAVMNFYRNNIGLGSGFEDIDGDIQPVFGVGSEGQISLDSRAALPIDAYRFK